MSEEKKLKGFNLGAATLGFFWSLRYNCFAKWAKAFCCIFIIPAILLIGFWVLYIGITKPAFWSWLGAIFISFISVIIQIIVSCIVLFIYSGEKANSWISSRQNLNLDEYKKEKKWWDICSVVILIFLLLVIAVFSVTCTIKSHNNKIKSHNAYLASKAREHLKLKNTCTVVNDIVPVIMKNSYGKFDKDDFAKELAKDSKVTEVISAQAHSNNEYTFSFDVENHDIGNYKGELRIGLLVKYIPTCNFNKPNCYVETGLYSNAEEKCRFYFDNNGNTIPSVTTKKILEE